jgi:hypothetical protein
VKLVLEKEIKKIQKRLDAAEQDVDRAQAEVDRLRYTPLMPEPSVLEKIERVWREIPMALPLVKG